MGAQDGDDKAWGKCHQRYGKENGWIIVLKELVQEEHGNRERYPREYDDVCGKPSGDFVSGDERERHDACFEVSSRVFEILVDFPCCGQQECKRNGGDDGPHVFFWVCGQ